MEGVRPLGDQLRDIGFDRPNLGARLGKAFSARTTPDVLAVARRRLGKNDPLSRAIAFWHLGISVSAADAADTFAPLTTDELVEAGLAVVEAEGIRAAVRISPFDGALIAHDFDDGGPLASDFVLGVGPATSTLASLTPRDEVERTLDLGTGSGAQALLAAAHSEQVVATDLSERAAWMAGLSAALSGVAGIDIRVGDGLAPVADERFDLIVANPPFVISPDTDLVFRDAPADGDEISRGIVRDAASMLRPGGMACVLINWIVHADDGEADTPRDWVADLGCDALILHHDTRDPVSYTQRWMMLPSSADPGVRDDTLDRWLSYYGALGARAIASGAVILRDRDGEARVRVEEMPKRPSNGGDQVRRMLDSFGRFEGAEDPALPRAIFKLVHGHRLDQELAYGHGSYEARDAVLRLERSAGVLGAVPADLIEVLFEIDGERAIDAIAADVAKARGEPADEFSSRLRPVILRLYELGFLDEVSVE